MSKRDEKMRFAKQLLLMILLVILVHSTLSYVPAQDIWFLYDNGTKITQSLLLFEERNETKVCYGGTCRISMYIIPYNITLLITADDKEILAPEQWCDNWKLSTPGCEGFVTRKDELSEADMAWRRTSEYKEYQSKIYNSSRSERKILWEEEKQAKLEFMHSRGLDFYGNSCNCDYMLLHDSYLSDLINKSHFKVEVMILNQSINFTHGQWDDRCFNVDIALGHSERIQCPEDDTFWNRLVLFIFLLAGILLLKYFTYLIIWIILIGLGIYTVRRILKKRGMKKGTKK